MTDQPKLGIVAGGGSLPGQIIETCQQQKRPYFVLALKDQADDPRIEQGPHAWLRLGQAGRSEKILRDQDVEEVVFVGAVKRPTLSELVPDLKTLRVMTRAAMEGLGDNGLLGLIIKEVEEAGGKVVGAHDVCPDLLATEGAFGRHRPDRQADVDIARGLSVLVALDREDVGQACAVQQGIVLAVEAIEGTDRMIARAGDVKRRGAGGVLVKIKKPSQDARIDMPTIGPATVHNVAAAGLRGIAVEAGATLVLERDETIREADKAGLFLIGVSATAAGGPSASGARTG